MNPKDLFDPNTLGEEPEQNFHQEYMNPFNPMQFSPQQHPVLPRYANSISPGTLNEAIGQAMENLGPPAPQLQMIGQRLPNTIFSPGTNPLASTP